MKKKHNNSNGEFVPKLGVTLVNFSTLRFLKDCSEWANILIHIDIYEGHIHTSMGKR